MRGPIDFIIVGFEGPKFDGSILSELMQAVDNGTIAVLALAAVAKDADGTVRTLEMTDANTLEVSTKFKLDNSLITQDDVDEVGDLLAEDTAAGILVVEHLWAKGLKQAIADNGGYLIADGRIHPEASEALNQKEG